MTTRTHDDELLDAANELRASECPRLADAVERARQALYGGPVSSTTVDVDTFEDPATGQLVLALAETCHA